MAYNSPMNIDELIKRIYKSYIEIKTGEFREIERDMLLNDISYLYAAVKEKFPSTIVEELPLLDIDSPSVEPDQIREVEIPSQSYPTVPANDEEPIDYTDKATQDAIEDNIANIPEIEIENPDSLPQEIAIEEIETPAVENTTTSSKVDLSMFGDDFFDEEIKTSPIAAEQPHTDLTDRRSDNKNSPVLQQFLGNQPLEYKPTSKEEEIVPTPKIEEKTIETTEVLIETPIEEIKVEPSIEPEKKSAGNIINFLKHEESPQKKDIYAFLDINTRIGLVEMFFKGNSLELTECLVKINRLDSKAECIEVINKYANMFGVKDTDDIYQQFVGLVNRKFQLA